MLDAQIQTLSHQYFLFDVSLYSILSDLIQQELLKVYIVSEDISISHHLHSADLLYEGYGFIFKVIFQIHFYLPLLP